MVKKVYLPVLLVILYLSIVYIKNKPLFPTQYDSDCPYYVDKLGRFYKRWENSFFFTVDFGPNFTWHHEKDVDIKNFSIIRKTADKKCVAYDGKYLFYEIYKIEDTDPESWEYIYNGYSKDKNTVYLISTPFYDADPKTFEVLKPERCYPINKYAKDKNYVYYEHQKEENADPSTFEVYCENMNFYGRDNDNIYKSGQVYEP